MEEGREKVRGRRGSLGEREKSRVKSEEGRTVIKKDTSNKIW